MEKQKKKELFGLCDPYKTYEPDSKLVIDIDNYFDEVGLLRGYDWAQKLFDTIDYGSGQSYQLFTGYSGSGKTTELKRVMALAKEEDYKVVYIDSSEFIDLNSPVDIVDIYMSVMYKTIEACNGGEFKDEGYFYRLGHWLHDTNINFKEIKGENLVLEMKERATLRQNVREHIHDSFGKFKSDVKDELKKLNDEVKAKGQRGILIIFDSMERNKGLSTNYTEVVAFSELLFAAKERLSLPLDIIYTVPPSLSERISKVSFLPAIKVIDKDNETYESGYKVLKALLYERVPENDVKEIFGDDYDKKLDELIACSGGYIRNLLQLMQGAILSKSYPLKDSDVIKLKQEEINNYSESVNDEIKNYLKRVFKDKSISGIDNIEVKDRLLNRHLILRYRNNDLWYDVHPAVKDLIED